MKLTLVYPEIENSNTNTATYSLPLGLGSIATVCREYGGIETKILDSSIMTHKEQLEAVKIERPDFIGINPTIASQRNAYEIAKAAKELGATVVFGGVHSTNLWRQMLTNRDFIDYVVLYEGEITTLDLLNKLESGVNYRKEDILNLAFREDIWQAVCKPKEIHSQRLSLIPDIDYSVFDLKRFLEQTERRGFGRAVTYYAGKGCPKRGNIELKQYYGYEEYQELVRSMNTCTFCGRNELGLRNIEEEREKRILHELHDKYGVTGFFNVQDSVNLNYTSPIGLEDCWFRLFIGAESITKENIDKLQRRYGPNLIFQVGVESANPNIRRAFGKSATSSYDLVRKVELMEREGIQLHASFILGGMGETPDTLQETTLAAEELARFRNVTWILMSPQLILPGSPDYRALLTRPGMHRKYNDEDLIDIPEISRDFLRNFVPSIDRDGIVGTIGETFADIRMFGRKNLVLDVKGVTKEEEEMINPSRDYAKG
jgi:radical SAM superfamily enzyme YgiQ (UPF0313 family)